MSGTWHVGIVGLGTVGRALARALHVATAQAAFAHATFPHAASPQASVAHDVTSRPVRLTAVSSRRIGAAASLAAELPGVSAVPVPALAAHVDVVLLAVGDADVRALAAAHAWRDGLVLAHCAGALGADVIADALAAAAAHVHAGALHPLVSLPRGHEVPADCFAGAVAAVGGDEVATAALTAIARAVGLEPVRVPDAQRARWHAAATLTGNAPAALLAHAEAMLAPLDLAPGVARRALLALLDSVVRNLHALPAVAPAAAAISGPVARGDAATVARHRAALAASPALRDAYDAAARLLSLALSSPSHAPSHDP
jgi:predicted short-subunit dehydrogenase-like oxidoreductase (DUF2520 family)